MALSLSVVALTLTGDRYASYELPLTHTGNSTNTSIKVFSASGVKDVGGQRASYYTPQISKVANTNIGSGFVTLTGSIDKNSANSVGAKLSIVYNPQIAGQLGANTVAVDKKSANSVGSKLVVSFNPQTSGQLANDSVFDTRSTSGFKSILPVNSNYLTESYAFAPLSSQFSLPKVIQVFSTAFSTTGGSVGESWS